MRVKERSREPRVERGNRDRDRACESSELRAVSRAAELGALSSGGRAARAEK